jgi:drug/metabolite transporter (DMT)-like permease
MSTGHPLRAALYLTLGLLLFACMDATTKYLSTTYDVPLIVGIRYGVNLALMILLLGPSQGRKMIETQRTALVVARACCLAAASLLVGLALQRMPVAETTTIGFLAPILVVAIAGPLLGEPASRTGWAAAILGFAGVILIVRPGSGLETVGVLCALGGVVANCLYQLLSRSLAATERTVAMLFYTALIGTIIFGFMMPWFWNGLRPTTLQALLFVSLGVYGGLGHFLFTAAYRLGPASMMSPMLYLQLLWAGLLGFVVFGHVPDGLSIVGMLAVVVSGLMVAVRSGRRPAT